MNATHEHERTLSVAEADEALASNASVITDLTQRLAEGDAGAPLALQRALREKRRLAEELEEAKALETAQAAVTLARERVQWRAEIESLKEKIEARRPAEVPVGEKWARAHLESEAAEREISVVVKETCALLRRMRFLESKLSGKPLVYNQAMDVEFRISLIKEREFRRISGRSSFSHIFPLNYFDPPAPKPTTKTAAKGKNK